MNNLDLWNRVSRTDVDSTKKVEFGRKFTAIDAYSQIKNATEEFGPYGAKWGLYDINYSPVENTSMMMVSGIFKHPSGEFPLTTGIIYSKNNKPDEDFPKKAETDLITKALSRLGFNADVFLGLFDDNKYVQETKAQLVEEARIKKVNDAIERHRETIDAIKDGMASGDLSAACEAYYELTDEEKSSIKVAPTKGGPFTTEEVKIFKSDEWAEARKGYFNAKTS